MHSSNDRYWQPTRNTSTRFPTEIDSYDAEGLLCSERKPRITGRHSHLRPSVATTFGGMAMVFSTSQLSNPIMDNCRFLQCVILNLLSSFEYASVSTNAATVAGFAV